MRKRRKKRAKKKRTGMTFNIKEELKKLPDQPGVYIMHDVSIFRRVMTKESRKTRW